MEYNILQIDVNFLFLAKGTGAGWEALKVLMTAMSHYTIANISQKLITLTKTTLPRALRDDTLIQSVLLNAILE